MCYSNGGFMDGYYYVDQDEIEQEEILQEMYMADLYEEDMMTDAQSGNAE